MRLVAGPGGEGGAVTIHQDARLYVTTLAAGEKHGYEIAEWIHAASAEALSVEEGALYPALHLLALLRCFWRDRNHHPSV